MLLQDHVALGAEARPDAAAVVMGAEALTYSEVDTLSDRLASLLVESGCEPDDRVGVLMPKRPSAIVAMHAVLKAGCAYVPLDTESPPRRLGRILASAQPRMILSIPQAAEKLYELAAVLDLPPVGYLEGEPAAGDRVEPVFGRGDWEGQTAGPPDRRGRADDIAHLLFTSGSTGDPKGVAITHRNVNAFLEWALPEFEYRATDRMSGHPPLHFDLSTFDIYGTLAAGAELHLVPPSMNLNPRALGGFIRDSRLTQWFSVPSVLTYMAKFDVIAQDDFPELARVLWCGEVLPTPILQHWMKRLPHVRFTNLYGPTEATIASSHYTVPAPPAADDRSVPIGTPCSGEELLVLDERLDPLPPGEIGDLYIAGAGLSPGYWRDEEKTRSSFLPDPRPGRGGARIYRTGDLARTDEDGLFHFLGRADTQIKSRGYRIELGEIESALSALGSVRECAVVAVDSEGFEGTTICAAYAPDGSDVVDAAVLRRGLSEHLPSYMLPARWLALEALPKNQNGKIDRVALRKQFAAG